jgi:hypothetical protein
MVLTIKGERHICGGPWIRRATCSTSWCNAGTTRGRRRSSFANS